MLRSQFTTFGGASAVALATVACAVTITASTPSHAQPTGLFGGGATFPEKVYRDIFNCYGNTSAGDTTAGLAAPPAVCNATAPVAGGRQVLYVGVGSGNGLNAFRAGAPSEYTHNSVTGATRTPDKPPVASTADNGPFYGTGNGTSWVPSGSAVNYFPATHFTGSDDPMTKTQLYGTVGNLSVYDDAHWGRPIQFPTMVGAVALPYSPASGTWTEAGKAVSGNQSKLKLSTTTWCGIFTGAIQDWNNSEITADNGNVSLTGNVSKTIYVAYRPDGSGTTFLFANALINQCGTASSHTAAQTHPVNDDWFSGGVKSDNSFFVKAKTNYDAAHGAGSFVIAFPTLHPADANGSGGMKSTIGAHTGAIGYVSPDFVNITGATGTPVNSPDPTGPKAANLQTWASFVAGGTKKFLPPNAKSSALIMKTALAPSFLAGSCATVVSQPDVGQAFDGICAHNALNWSHLEPAPTNVGAYPIGGFTYINMYSCYASADVKNGLADKLKTGGHTLGLWRLYFGSASEWGGTDQAKASLTANGFSKPPSSWISGAKKLLTTDKATFVSYVGEFAPGKQGGCTNVTVGKS